MYVGISAVFNTLVSRLRERSFRESIGDGRTRGQINRIGFRMNSLGDGRPQSNQFARESDGFRGGAYPTLSSCALRNRINAKRLAPNRMQSEWASARPSAPTCRAPRRTMLRRCFYPAYTFAILYIYHIYIYIYIYIYIDIYIYIYVSISIY